MKTILLISALAALPAVAQTTPPPLATATGRAVFRLDEPVVFQLRAARATDAPLTATLRAATGVERRVRGRLVGGRAHVTAPPFALAAGDWTLHWDAHQLPVTIVTSLPNTPFTICVYSGDLPGDTEQKFGGPPPMPVADRIQLWRDVYGVNHIMSLGRPASFPPVPAQLDRIARVGARLTAQHVVAGQHQPGGTSTSWADPAVQLACRYQAQHVAQTWRHAAGALFQGVHYADEPGLTWGIGHADGTLRHMFPGEGGWYTGPLAVPAQHALYTARTGTTPPDWRDPLARFDEWREFQRFRVTILGDLFAQLTRDVQAVDTNLWGYSQIYAWRTTAEGIYPPQMAKGVDVLSSHGYAMWTWLGHAYPAHEVDALRSGAWDKPLWYLAPWLGHQAETGGVRAVVYGALARKVEGLTWPLDWMQFWPEAAEVSAKILPLSAALAQSQKPRDAVGLLQSLDQHARTVAENWRAPFPDRPYEGKLMTAWWASMAAGFPATRVVEEDLLNGAAAAHQVILAPGLTDVRPVVRQALRDYLARGGTVVFDAAATLDLPGAVRLPFAFGNGFDTNAVPAFHPIAGANQRLAYDNLVAPVVDELRATLRQHAAPLIEADNPHLLLGQANAGGGRYYWVVNNETRRADNIQFVPVPAQATITLPVATGEALYDVFARRALDSPTQTVAFAAGDARLYAVAPGSVGAPTLTARWDSPALRVTVDVGVDMIVPLTLELFAPTGERLLQLHRATTAGRYEDPLPLGAAILPGAYRLQVRENLTDQTSAVTVIIPRAKLPPLPAATAPVELRDAARARAMLAPGRAVLILTGTAATERAGQALAQALTRRGLTVRVDAATNHTTQVAFPIQGQIWPFFGGVYNYPLAIHQPVILLGDRATNPAMKALVDTYQLAPRTLAADDPGPGRALVWWATAAFGLASDIVAIYAGDDRGLDRGIAAVLQETRADE